MDTAEKLSLRNLSDSELKEKLKNLLKEELQDESSMKKEDIKNELIKKVQEVDSNPAIAIDYFHGKDSFYARHGICMITNPHTGNNLNFNF
jgi:ferredoxin-fold anticodon binding domain-containing protein